jgi:1-acyl-sn-glycerol-3-phosphate acyltransferase
LPFKPGGFAVAVETGVPVVPVTINGSRAIMPSGDWRVRAGEIEVIVGEPIQVDLRASKKAARDELQRKVQETIAASHRSELSVAVAGSPIIVPSSSPGRSTS